MDDREKRLEESRLIMKIVNRGWRKMKRNYKTRLDMIMDLDAAHKCCPLRLQELLGADDIKFYHFLLPFLQHHSFTPKFTK